MPYSKSEAIIFLVFMTLFILVMVVFIIIILFSVQKKQKKFTDALIEAKTNFDRELLKVQTEIQEQAFEDISREIHDNIGQQLSMARLCLNTLDTEDVKEFKENKTEISEMLGDAIQDLRELSHNLNSNLIKKLGLAKAIENRLGSIQKAGIFDVKFELNGNYRKMEDNKTIFIFRIFQEALTNIIRHSEATEIIVVLSYTDDYLELIISDNGKGFLIKEQFSESITNNGINNMQYRAKLISAVFDITSKPDEGTTIKINTLY